MVNDIEVSQNIKNRTTIQSRNPTSGYLSKENKTLTQEDAHIPIFIAALITTDRIWKQPKCPSTDEWVKKMWSTPHTMEYFSGIKTSETLPCVTRWMDVEGIRISETS